jgi:hypothetical protein
MRKRRAGVFRSRTPIARRLVFVLVTLSSTTVAVAALPVARVDSGAADWAARLSPGELRSATASGAVPLPSEYRRAVYNRLVTAEDRASFWQGEFARFKALHTLSAEQGDVVERARALAVPATFLGARTPEGNFDQLSRAVEAIRGALGPQAVRELFYAAGPGQASALPLGERLRYVWRTAGLRMKLALVVPVLHAYDSGCNCAVGGPDDGSNCGYEQHCYWNEQLCPQSEWTEWGCGPWWLSPCDGHCAYGPPA